MLDRSPQTAPATALVQLLQEHPELPPIRWTISPSGWFSGTYHPHDSDPRPVMAAYAAVLGGAAKDLRYNQDDGAWLAVILNTTWRDVTFYLSMGAPLAVALAGELAEQRHQLLDPAVPPWTPALAPEAVLA